MFSRSLSLLELPPLNRRPPGHGGSVEGFLEKNAFFRFLFTFVTRLGRELERVEGLLLSASFKELPFFGCDQKIMNLA